MGCAGPGLRGSTAWARCFCFDHHLGVVSDGGARLARDVDDARGARRYDDPAALRRARLAGDVPSPVGTGEGPSGGGGGGVANNLDSRIGRFEELLVGRAETVTTQIETPHQGRCRRAQRPHGATEPVDQGQFRAKPNVRSASLRFPPPTQSAPAPARPSAPCSASATKSPAASSARPTRSPLRSASAPTK